MKTVRTRSQWGSCYEGRFWSQIAWIYIPALPSSSSTFLSPFPALINEGDNGTTSSVAVRIAPRKDFRAELVNDGSVSRSEFRLGRQSAEISRPGTWGLDSDTFFCVSPGLRPTLSPLSQENSDTRLSLADQRGGGWPGS